MPIQGMQFAFAEHAVAETTGCPTKRSNVPIRMVQKGLVDLRRPFGEGTHAAWCLSEEKLLTAQVPSKLTNELTCRCVRWAEARGSTSGEGIHSRAHFLKQGTEVRRNRECYALNARGVRYKRT